MRVFLPFFDDSTLFFANKLSGVLNRKGVETAIALLPTKKAHLTTEQIQRILNKNQYWDLSNRFKCAKATRKILNYDAIISAKAYPLLKKYKTISRLKKNQNSPCFIAFHPGLEFTPNKGYHNRLYFDAHFMPSKEQANSFKRSNKQHTITYGHPYFLTPETTPHTPQGNDIVFFAQALSPPSITGRQHIIDLLCDLAVSYPERKIILKLRHLSYENKHHAHKEHISLDDILRKKKNIPDNIVCTACTMDEALETAAYAFSCTSTATMDALSAGIPAAIYLDYPDANRDPLAEGCKHIFKDSGLFISHNDILSLNFSPAREAWKASFFMTEDELFSKILSAIQTKRGSPLR